MKNATIALAILIFSLVPTLAVHAQPTVAQSQAVQSEETQPSPDMASPEEPKPEQERPTVWGEPTEVKIFIYVIDVDGVDSANQKFTASLYYQAVWNSPTLRHQGPGPLIKGTIDVWTPRLTIVNQQEAWASFPNFVEISPGGDVVLRQKIWGSFSQPMDLRDFPIDRQRLTVHIAAAGLKESQVAMVPLIMEDGKASGIAKQFSIPDFDVVSWKVERRPYVVFEGFEGTAGFVIEIDVQRQMNYYFWKLILPLCLIVMMSWIPRWVDPSQIGTNIGVATTSFLTLVAYLFAVAHLLPRISYFTRLDQFILLSTLMVFVSLLQTVATTTLSRGKATVPIELVERWSRIAYPVILLAVLGISFGL